jgi:hypothetical protein
VAVGHGRVGTRFAFITCERSKAMKIKTNVKAGPTAVEYPVRSLIIAVCKQVR